MTAATTTTAATKFLLVDNYDSFTYNLLHLFAVHAGVEVCVRRNDDDLLGALATGAFDGVVISPGPGSAEDKKYFGHNAEVITQVGTRGMPILGICLGFQGIYHCFGGRLKIATPPMHGKTSAVEITSPDSPLFANIPPVLEVMRYHSIVADVNDAPACLTLSARVCDGVDSNGGGELMAIEHKEHPIYGVQFHPESFATEWGQTLIGNFINITRRHVRRA